MGAGIDRLQGYRDAIRQGGLHVDESYEQAGDFGQESGAIAMQALLGRHPDLDAVFCASDVMAVGALEILRQQERRHTAGCRRRRFRRLIDRDIDGSCSVQRASTDRRDGP